MAMYQKERRTSTPGTNSRDQRELGSWRSSAIGGNTLGTTLCLSHVGSDEVVNCHSLPHHQYNHHPKLTLDLSKIRTRNTERHARNPPPPQWQVSIDGCSSGEVSSNEDHNAVATITTTTTMDGEDKSAEHNNFQDSDLLSRINTNIPLSSSLTSIVPSDNPDANSLNFQREETFPSREISNITDSCIGLVGLHKGQDQYALETLRQLLFNVVELDHLIGNIHFVRLKEDACYEIKRLLERQFLTVYDPLKRSNLLLKIIDSMTLRSLMSSLELPKSQRRSIMEDQSFKMEPNRERMSNRKSVLWKMKEMMNGSIIQLCCYDIIWRCCTNSRVWAWCLDFIVPLSCLIVEKND